jgi:tRNA threonylcarbamoyladenosine biosynthesis protein TsaE
MEIITKSTEETQELGRKIANKLVSSERSSAIVLALSGDLGSGKTTFTQGFARGLGIEKRILSPTFILMRSYELLEGRYFYHIDLYRLEEKIKEELENLGAFDIFKDPKSIVIIEWAEKAKESLPENTIWLNFCSEDENTRRIEISKDF